jgi:hypothetical protein
MCLDMGGDEVWASLNVIVDEQEQPSSGNSRSGVPGSRCASVLLRADMDGGRGWMRTNCRLRMVGTSVGHHDDLEVPGRKALDV